MYGQIQTQRHMHDVSAQKWPGRFLTSADRQRISERLRRLSSVMRSSHTSHTERISHDPDQAYHHNKNIKGYTRYTSAFV